MASSEKLIPNVGDIVLIKSRRYSGEAVVNYILQEYLHLHHFAPIQCEISESDLHKVKDRNSDQIMIRVSLAEIEKILSPEEKFDNLDDNEQITLF